MAVPPVPIFVLLFSACALKIVFLAWVLLSTFLSYAPFHKSSTPRNPEQPFSPFDPSWPPSTRQFLVFPVYNLENR